MHYESAYNKYYYYLLIVLLYIFNRKTDMQ